MIAAGLGQSLADEMQVWKESMAFSPLIRAKCRLRACCRASLLPRLPSWTYFGSEVLHPFTMERVVGAGADPNQNTFKPDAPGTVICSHEEARPGCVTAVTVKRDICVVTITSNRMYNAHGFGAGVRGAGPARRRRRFGLDERSQHFLYRRQAR